MSNKTISINPSLFSGGIHTRKNRAKKEKNVKKALISPNVLKNKLLKRIKEHKQSEIKDVDNKTKFNLNSNIIDESSEMNTFSDEFNDSINYLQTLSNQKQIKDSIEVKKRELERKTLKNYNEQFVPNVNIDLPEELITRPLVTINTDEIVYSDNNLQTLTKMNEVPYGVLKNGTKPTYRNWMKTQRNNVSTHPTLELSSHPSPIYERENRLSNLREKIQQKKIEEQLRKQDETLITTNVINSTPEVELVELNPINIHSKTVNNFVEPPMISYDNNTTTNMITAPSNIIATKKITKKTIKKKYILGKNKSKNIVSLLIKDKGTRKQIINAHKKLKSTTINDVKSELRKCNLIKIGSNAPNDILRKLYESSMLTGEVTNVNTDLLLHNLTNNDRE